MKYSLKFKILFGISLVLVLSTAFNLIYSYRLFVEDKTSYIFESGLRKVENISDQLNYKLNDLATRTEFNSILINSSSVNFEKLINNQEDIVLAGEVTLQNTKAEVTRHYVNTKNINRISNQFNINTKDFLSTIIDSSKNMSFLKEDRSWIFSPKDNLKFLIHFTKTNKNNSFYFSISDLNPFLEIFSKDSTYKTKIISLGDSKEILNQDEFFKQLDPKKSKKGTLETTIQSKLVLLSYSFVNDKILVISSIAKDDAFGITKFLILKTFLFALFLLGIFITAGLFFSSTITLPINKLIGKSKSVAAGDFSNTETIHTTDELKILDETFNFMCGEIQSLLKNKEVLIAKLEDYNKNLEQMVAQRTFELKEANDFMALMVNSLDQGLLVFDQNLKFHPTYTKACEPIFGLSPKDKTLPEVLDIKEEDSVKSLNQWAMVVFNELIPFESAIDLGPRKKVNGNSYHDSNFKHVSLNYYPMRDQEEKISNVVMIATDKTKEVQATESAKEKEVYVSMILKILNNKSQFESFIAEVEEIFDQFKNAYSLEKNTIEFDLCMMLFHTLNGGFSIYSINKLQSLAREYETEISNIKDSNPEPSEYIPFLQGHVNNLKEEFFNFRKELDLLIGTKFATNQSFTEVSRDQILLLKELIKLNGNEEVYQYYVENFVKVPVMNYFKAYDELCKTAAIKIGKEFSGITYHNEDLRLEVEPLLEFFNVLVHLFRNCLDHGIEDSYTRQSLNKSPNGHIDVTFDLITTENGILFSIVIQDDGGGINPDLIREKYSKLKPDEDISIFSDKEIIYKIFDPFFSTRDEVSLLSGRGVGMSAIKEVVDRMNGQIEIESHLHKGTIFSFLIPLN
jgi:two-component system chemotaxis sensor kinase CheA